MERTWWQPALAEFLGVLALVFVGAGSIVSLNQMADTAIATSHTGGGGQTVAATVGIALAHGLTIAVMVMAVGHISGGHFNPAVTVAAMFTRRMKPDMGFLYILFQLLGGVAGAFLLVSALPSNWWEVYQLGTPQVNPGLDRGKAVLVEAVLTFFLVFVIFGSAIDGKRNPSSVVAGLAIGLTVTVDILVGGYLTGAAMNPARWFGPALLSNFFTNHFVYWAGPLLGGIIAGLVYDAAYLERKPAASAPPETPPAPPPA